MRQAPFVGRERELGQLDRELLAARAGTRLVFLVGEAGVGKTRALSEFQVRARPRARFLVGRGSPLGAGVAFSLVVEALESHLRGLPASSVRALCGARIGALRDVLPSVAAAAAGEEAQPSSRVAVLEAFLVLFDALAAERPLVLVLDDAHRADPSTWELLGYIARNAPGSRLLILAAVRDEAGERTAAADGSVDLLLKDGLAAELRLPPLAEEDVRVLAVRALGPAASADVDWLFQRTRGNALFTTALIDDLADDPDHRAVPRSIRGHVESLASGLDPGTRTVLETAAALGHSFPLRAIAAQSARDAGQRLQELVRRGLLTERPRHDDARYDFTHPLVQEVIYENLGAARRRELHEELARTLEAEPLAVRAYHAALGALPGDTAAISVIWKAAREAERAQAHREALQHLTALKRLINVAAPERATVLDEIGWQAAEAGEHALGIDALRELLARQDGPAARATVHMRLASLRSAGPGDLRAAEAEAQEAVRLLELAHEDHRLASALNELAWIRGEAGDLAAQIEGSSAALARAEALGDETLALHALGSLGYAYAGRGQHALASAALRRGHSIALARGDQMQTGWHTGALGFALLCSGRVDEATRVLDALLDGGPSPSAIPYVNRAFLNWSIGRLTQALDDHRAVQALHPGALPVYAAWSATLAGLVETAMGEDGAGVRHLEQGIRAYANSDFYYQGILHDWALGSARALSGDLASACALHSRAAARAAAMGAPAIEAFVLPDLVAVQVALGSVAHARASAARARQVAVTLGTANAAANASYGEGLVAHAERRTDPARTALRTAADVAASLGLRVLEARALESLARTYEGADRIEHATNAARIYAAIGARRLEDRVRSDLRGLGAAGRRVSQAIGELTPREREVVSLVRAGLANREIADRLHVSERTIETHLAHVYGKLGVRSRRELLRG